MKNAKVILLIAVLVGGCATNDTAPEVLVPAPFVPTMADVATINGLPDNVCVSTQTYSIDRLYSDMIDVIRPKPVEADSTR